MLFVFPRLQTLRKGLIAAILVSLFLLSIRSLATDSNGGPPSKDILDRQEPTRAIVEDAHKRCQGFKSSGGADNTILLYTKSVGITQRRQLHVKHHQLNLSSDDVEAGCSAFASVERFVHPRPPRVQPDALYFHLATTVGRLINPDASLQQWLPHSNIHLLLTLRTADQADAEKVAVKHLKKLGLASFHIQRAPVGEIYGDSWANGLPKMVELAANEHRKIDYYVLLDDDTFITSMTNYRHVLDVHNPDEEIVIGAPSETVDQAKYTWAGVGGFGGSSMVLTRALAENVATNWVASRYYRKDPRAGDIKLDGAIAFCQARPVRSPNIYYERAFHQNDIGGWPESVFKAGFRWITIHHMGRFEVYPGVYKNQQITQIGQFSRLMDSENLFSNYLLKQDENQTVVLTHGFGITTYSPPLTGYQLYQLEDGSQGRFAMQGWAPTHGPYRPKTEEHKQKKTAWFKSMSRKSPQKPGADHYSLEYEYKSPEGVIERTIVDWIVRPENFSMWDSALSPR